MAGVPSATLPQPRPHPCSNHWALQGKDLGKAGWTGLVNPEPCEQTTNYATPSCSDPPDAGPRLQRTQPLKINMEVLSSGTELPGRRTAYGASHLGSGLIPPHPWPLSTTPWVDGKPVTGVRLPAWPGASMTPAWPPHNRSLCSPAPHCLQFSRLPAPGQRRISRGISQWARREASCLWDLLLPAFLERPQSRMGADDPW